MHIYQKNIVFQIRLVEKRTFRFDSKTFFVKIWQIFEKKIVKIFKFLLLPKKWSPSHNTTSCPEKENAY